MNNILNIIKDESLSYQQKMINLAKEAENSINPLHINNDTKDLIEKDIICDLSEGKAPFIPRYILPDYNKFMIQGSKFLGLNPPENLLEAVNNLLIIYSHVPSVTSFPVYLGNIDTLLEPFIENKNEDYKIIKMFLKNIDRTLTDAFVHANIGPKETKAGKLILRAERELRNTVPNLTLKYNNSTPDSFAIEAIKTSFETSKPYFANHDMFVTNFGKEYGIASCYNGLLIGGGSYTLVRLNLKKLAEESYSYNDFLLKLDKAIYNMNSLIDERIRFIVEESSFFKNNFLIKEKLVSLEKFTAMFGIFGLAECVNVLLFNDNKKEIYGKDKRANELGVKIINHIEKIVNKHINKYAKGTDNKFLLHAQSGIASDTDVSPGCRIPIGDELDIYSHIKQASLFHKKFPSGISDIFTFEETVKKNPDYILDIIKGSMKEGIRMFSFYISNSDLIRITGYLVKKSEIEKLENNNNVLKGTEGLGKESIYNQKILNRLERK